MNDDDILTDSDSDEGNMEYLEIDDGDSDSGSDDEEFLQRKNSKLRARNRRDLLIYVLYIGRQNAVCLGILIAITGVIVVVALFAPSSHHNGSSKTQQTPAPTPGPCITSTGAPCTG